MRTTQLFDAATGFGPIDSLVAAGDPSVHWFGDRWWMVFGAASKDGLINLYSASLPPGAPVDGNNWTIVAEPDDGTRARRLIQPGEPGTRNKCIHTPCYVRGELSDGRPVERLYVTGSRADGPDDRLFSIGVLERVGDEWVCLDRPVLVGQPPRVCRLEPKVIFDGGRWRMWVTATEREPGPGERPDYQTHYLESADGLSGWSEPEILFDNDANYLDAVVTPLDDGYGMVVAAAPNMFGAEGFPPQGLWWLRSRRASGLRSDWSADPLQLIDGDNGETWYRGGVYGPSLVPGDRPGTLHVFFTGTRVPDPRPYVLSIGRLDLDVSTLDTERPASAEPGTPASGR